MEGIIPALESSHAVAHAIKLAKTMKKDEIILVNLSGRGDKDIDYVLEHYLWWSMNQRARKMVLRNSSPISRSSKQIF